MTVAAGCKLSSDELIAVLKASEGKLRALGIISVSMFGSRLRGDNRPDSDLDLLVDYDKSRKFSLLDLAHVENYLLDVIGWQGVSFMYGYFFLSGLLKRFFMPSLGKLIAKESDLEGFYRTAARGSNHPHG